MESVARSPAELGQGAMGEAAAEGQPTNSHAAIPCSLQPEGLLFQPEMAEQGADEAGQRKGVLERARALVEAVVSSVHAQDALFTREVLQSGSYAQGLHVQGESSASDLDFVVPLDYQVKMQVVGSLSKDPPGDFRSLLPQTLGSSSVVSVFFRNNKLLLDFDRLLEDHSDGDLFPPGSPMTYKEMKDVLKKHCLDPKQVLVRFRTRIIKFFKSDSAWKKRFQDSEGNAIGSWGQILPYYNIDDECEVTILQLKKYCPAVQLAIQWGDQKLPLSVDLVPIIRIPFQQWPSEWPRQEVRWLMEWADGWRRKEADWKLQKIQEVCQTCIYLVPKEVWSLNFSCAETVLIQGIDADGGHRRDALKLLKLTNMVSWIKKYGKVLTSFHLKAILLWSCDLNPGPENWMTLLSSMETLLKTLHYSLQTEVLPHYFLPSVNLFKAKQVDLENVEQRELGLKYVLEEVKVMQVFPFDYIHRELEKNIEVSQYENIAPLEECWQGLHKSSTCYREEYQQQFPDLYGTRKQEEMFVWNSFSDPGEVLIDEYSEILKEILPLNPGKNWYLEEFCPRPYQYAGQRFSACQYDFYDPEPMDDEHRNMDETESSDYDNNDEDYDDLGDYEQDYDLECSDRDSEYMYGEEQDFEDRDDYKQGGRSTEGGSAPGWRSADCSALRQRRICGAGAIHSAPAPQIFPGGGAALRAHLCAAGLLPAPAPWRKSRARARDLATDWLGPATSPLLAPRRRRLRLPALKGPAPAITRGWGAPPWWGHVSPPGGDPPPPPQPGGCGRGVKGVSPDPPRPASDACPMLVHGPGMGWLRGGPRGSDLTPRSLAHLLTPPGDGAGDAPAQGASAPVQGLWMTLGHAPGRPRGAGPGEPAQDALARLLRCAGTVDRDALR